MRSAMMPTVTSSSTIVKAARLVLGFRRYRMMLFLKIRYRDGIPAGEPRESTNVIGPRGATARG
ncbi:MAG: hypothetical protein ACKOGJ_08235, partial [Phycisphaerales bacterium]